MKQFGFVVVLLLCSLAIGHATAVKHRASVSASPVGKVITLLTEMRTKGESELQAEAVSFAKFKQWCEDTAKEKKNAIRTNSGRIEKLEADASKNKAEGAQCVKDAQTSHAESEGFRASKKEIQTQRAKDLQEFTALSKDYAESVSALRLAIQTIQSQELDRTQKKALLQSTRAAVRFPVGASKIASFIEDDDEEPSPYGTIDLEAPKPKAYDSSAGSILDMLRDLLTKFEGDLATLQKEEAKAVSEFKLMVNDLTHSYEKADAVAESKSQESAEKKEAAAACTSRLLESRGTLESDENLLAGLTTDCQAKNEEFKNRQIVRKEEIEAISKAVDFLQEFVVSNVDKHLPGGVSGSSFIQQSADRADVASFLNAKAKVLHSKILSAIALRAREDPLSKVKQLMQDLITRLSQEALDEKDHKGWCDAEMQANQGQRERKGQEKEKLTATIDKHDAETQQLKEEINNLTTEKADLEGAVAKAVSLRAEESKKNAETVADAQASQAAVSKALTILKEFYEKQGTPASFVQTTASLKEKEPESLEGPIPWEGNAYVGSLGEGGVVSLLEIIISDFSRLEAETSTDEAATHKSHTEFIKEAAVNNVRMQKDIEFKTHKISVISKALQVATKDLEAVAKELAAANEYHEKLMPSCVNPGVSPEDRAARRKEEIESLRQALEIISGNQIGGSVGEQPSMEEVAAAAESPSFVQREEPEKPEPKPEATTADQKLGGEKPEPKPEPSTADEKPEPTTADQKPVPEEKPAEEGTGTKKVLLRRHLF